MKTYIKIIILSLLCCIVISGCSNSVDTSLNSDNNPAIGYETLKKWDKVYYVGAKAE
ncbi:hypothetical protein [Clostridium sp.]|uniref:hypothetical protein n=1 Tax=Clostridium sp. TaxID=1506 RepID=UPI002FDE72DD